MMHQERFLEAVKASGITQVVVIDDAFDPPAITRDTGGAFLDYLERQEHEEARHAAGLTDAEINTAVDAIGREAFDEPIVETVVNKLYEQYVATLHSKFDPGDVFRDAKSDNLKNLIPLLALLMKCNPPLTITRVGSDVSAIAGVPEDTHLIFVDFYLDKTLGAVDTPRGKRKLDAKEASIERIRRIMSARGRDTPSVVLMSSS